MNTTVLCAISVIACQAVNGAGFILMEHRISGLGVGFASGAGGLSDNSSVCFNPTTLTMVEGTQVTAGMHMILPKADFSNNGSFSTRDATQGPDATTDEMAVVPNLYISRQLTDDLVVGFSETTTPGHILRG